MKELAAVTHGKHVRAPIFAIFTRDIVAFGDEEHRRKNVEPTFDLHDKIVRKHKISEREDRASLSIGTTGEVHQRNWRLAGIRYKY
jgi:hypothetical protein